MVISFATERILTRVAAALRKGRRNRIAAEEEKVQDQDPIGQLDRSVIVRIGRIRDSAKEVIDAFGYRASKGVTSGLIGAAGWLAGPLPGVLYPVVALLAALGWYGVAHRISEERTGVFL